MVGGTPCSAFSMLFHAGMAELSAHECVQDQPMIEGCHRLSYSCPPGPPMLALVLISSNISFRKAGSVLSDGPRIAGPPHGVQGMVAVDVDDVGLGEPWAVVVEPGVQSGVVNLVVVPPENQAFPSLGVSAGYNQHAVDPAAGF